MRRSRGNEASTSVEQQTEQWGPSGGDTGETGDEGRVGSGVRPGKLHRPL